MRACRSTVESEDRFFNSKDEAEIYLKKHRGWDYWAKVNSENDNAYYEVINSYAAVLRYKNSSNYRILTYSICDFYENID